MITFLAIEILQCVETMLVQAISEVFAARVTSIACCRSRGVRVEPL